MLAGLGEPTPGGNLDGRELEVEAGKYTGCVTPGRGMLGKHWTAAA